MVSSALTGAALSAARAALAPSGVLRAGINLSNIILVNGISDDNSPSGVAPSLCKTPCSNR